MAEKILLMCEKMDYSFEGIRASKGSVCWGMGGTKGYHTQFCCKKYLLVQLELMLFCVASVFSLRKALLRE